MIFILKRAKVWVVSGWLILSGGKWNGRRIEVPQSEGVRPTQGKWRQAWFNSLQTRIQGARVLDLFSGSGALGFEALSRGADFVVSVDHSVQALQIIEKNRKLLGCTSQMQIVRGDLTSFLPSPFISLDGQAFDLVLADPPYKQGWENRLLTGFPFASLLTSGGLFCLEWNARLGKGKDFLELPEEVPHSELKKIRERCVGEIRFTTYQKSEPEDSDERENG